MKKLSYIICFFLIVGVLRASSGQNDWPIIIFFICAAIFVYIVNELSCPEFSSVHIQGLPLTEGANCKVSYIKNKSIQFSKDKTVINLDLKKIIDSSIVTEDGLKQYISSIGGGIAGAMIAGPLGAIIGGRIKKKDIKKTRYFFNIIYQTDEIKCVSLEIQEDELIEAKKLNKILIKKKEKQNIELS